MSYIKKCSIFYQCIFHFSQDHYLRIDFGYGEEFYCGKNLSPSQQIVLTSSSFTTFLMNVPTEGFNPSYTGFQFNYQCLPTPGFPPSPTPGKSFVSHDEYPTPYTPTLAGTSSSPHYIGLYDCDDR